MTGAWMLVVCLLGGIASRDQAKVQAKNRVDCNIGIEQIKLPLGSLSGFREEW